jgi:hypothetical protein
MHDDTDLSRFIKVAYDECAKLFAEGEAELLTTRDEAGRSLPDVLIRHRPTGIELEVSEFPTQTMNAVIARIRLAERIRKSQ